MSRSENSATPSESDDSLDRALSRLNDVVELAKELAASGSVKRTDEPPRTSYAFVSKDKLPSYREEVVVKKGEFSVDDDLSNDVEDTSEIPTFPSELSDAERMLAEDSAAVSEFGLDEESECDMEPSIDTIEQPRRFDTGERFNTDERFDSDERFNTDKQVRLPLKEVSLDDLDVTRDDHDRSTSFKTDIDDLSDESLAPGDVLVVGQPDSDVIDEAEEAETSEELRTLEVSPDQIEKTWAEASRSGDADPTLDAEGSSIRSSLLSDAGVSEIELELDEWLPLPESTQFDERPELIDMIDHSINVYVAIEDERILDMIKARDDHPWVSYTISRSNQRIFTFDIHGGEWICLQSSKTGKVVSAVGGLSTNFPASHNTLMPLMIFSGMVLIVIGFLILDQGIVLNLGLVLCCVAAFAWFYYNIRLRLTLDVTTADFIVNAKYQGPLDCLREVKLDKHNRVVAVIDFKQKTVEEVIAPRIPKEQRTYLVEVLNKELDTLRAFEKNGS